MKIATVAILLIGASGCCARESRVVAAPPVPEVSPANVQLSQGVSTRIDSGCTRPLVCWRSPTKEEQDYFERQYQACLDNEARRMRRGTR